MDLLLTQIHIDFQSIRTKHSQQFETDLDQERQKSRDQTRAILTPEQLPKFEEFLNRMDEERKKNAPPPGMRRARRFTLTQRLHTEALRKFQ